MSLINADILRFTEEGLFSKDLPKGYFENKLIEVEKKLYEIGLDRFLSELKGILTKKIALEMNVKFSAFRIVLKDNMIYLQSENPDNLIATIPSDVSYSEKVLFLESQLPIIVGELFKRLQVEVNDFKSFKEVLTSSFDKVYKGPKNEETEIFEPLYPLLGHLSKEVILNVSYQENGYRAHLSLKEEGTYYAELIDVAKEHPSSLLSKETPSEEYANIMIEIALKKLTEKVESYEKSAVYSTVIQRLKRMTDIPEFHSSRDVGMSDEKEIYVHYNRVYIPYTIDEAGLLKVAAILKLIKFIESRTGEVKKVLGEYRLSTNNATNLEKGFISADSTVEDLQELVIQIRKDISRVEFFIYSKEIPVEGFKIDYYKSLFVRKRKEFEHNGSQFVLFEYRTPERRKTFFKAFENGQECSFNRYQKAQRKFHKVEIAN